MPFSFRILGAIAILSAGCASKPGPTMQTRPLEPGLGACKTQLQINGTTGLVRYVPDGKTTRELWDADGDGSPEAELRKRYDDQGRLVRIERLQPDGTVAERVERTYDGERLVMEETDRWTTEGHPGPDGTVDWRRELHWEQGALVSESIDELDEEGLPGTDGEPEFIVDWSVEDGHRISGTRRHRDGMVVATYALEWDGERLSRQVIDYGADGKVDQDIRYVWRGDRVTRIETTGTAGDSVVEHEYCR